MALDCADICGKVLTDQLIDCNTAFIKGIEQQILLINRCDIDTIVVDKTDTTHKATNITLKSGSQGYLIQGLNGKTLFYHGHTINANDDGPDDVTHEIGMRGYNMSEANLIYIRSLVRGADLVAITLDKVAGASDDKYKVHGLEQGLKVNEYSFKSNENKAAFIYTLTSRGEDQESVPPLVWLEADEATTDAKYATQLAVA